MDEIRRYHQTYQLFDKEASEAKFEQNNHYVSSRKDMIKWRHQRVIEQKFILQRKWMWNNYSGLDSGHSRNITT
jgi:hypothetical protein